MKAIKKRTDWKSIIDEWQREKPQVVSFCQERKVSKASFYYWQKRLIPHSSITKKPLSKTDFVPIEICPETYSSKGNDEITLYYPNGCYLKLTEGCSLKLLRLVNEMMRVSSC